MDVGGVLESLDELVLLLLEDGHRLLDLHPLLVLLEDAVDESVALREALLALLLHLALLGLHLLLADHLLDAGVLDVLLLLLQVYDLPVLLALFLQAKGVLQLLHLFLLILVLDGMSVGLPHGLVLLQLELLVHFSLLSLLLLLPSVLLVPLPGLHNLLSLLLGLLDLLPGFLFFQLEEGDSIR